MSKILEASCENGAVTVEGLVIEATILSAGVEASTGVVIIQNGNAFYIASTYQDLVSIIEKTAEMITDISNILTAIGAGMTGATTAPPPSLAADVSELQGKATTLDQVKGNLR